MDNNVVSALERQDQRPEENEAILLLKHCWDHGRITPFVSAVHDREQAPPERYRAARERMLAKFPRSSSRMIICFSASICSRLDPEGGTG